MSVSAIFGGRLVIPVIIPSSTTSYPAATKAAPSSRVAVGDFGLKVQCSSRPQKKATKHHMKSRPRKTNPSDIRRGPTVYPPFPAMPPEWSFVTEDGAGKAEPQWSVESQ